VHEVLNVYEAVRKQEAKAGIKVGERRHRIEHVQVIQPDDVPRLAQLGVIASMQPNHAISDMDMSERYWGERSEFAYNWRLQLDAGAALALGSDAPIEPIEPLPNIQAAVTRRRADGSPGPEGWRPGTNKRLTVDEAVRGFTRGPAYAAGMENRVGQIAPGFLADVVILGQNIYECDPMAIGETDVLGTVVGGRWVWRNLYCPTGILRLDDGDAIHRDQGFAAVQALDLEDAHGRVEVLKIGFVDFLELLQIFGILAGIGQVDVQLDDVSHGAARFFHHHEKITQDLLILGDDITGGDNLPGVIARVLSGDEDHLATGHGDGMIEASRFGEGRGIYVAFGHGRPSTGFLNLVSPEVIIRVVGR
jgi:hypothetical protein